MPIQKQLIKPIGMMQDNLITSPKSNQFAHEIKNLRFNTQGDFVTASWTTEQSTLKLNIEGLSSGLNYLDNQIPVGQSVINDQMILFTTDARTGIHIDRIYKFTYKDKNTINAVELYTGNLNLDSEHPLETLSYYENEDIQKVYWTDGINQPRMINICNTYTTNTGGIDYQFDFIKELSLKEDVTVSKQQGGSGQFPPCTVKYAITYYNKYGQESNIVWTSSLCYPTKGDRALKEDELSGDIFVITVDNVDIQHKYDYIRLYSIVRTTDNATPIVRIVESKSIKDLNRTNNRIVFYDSNTTGEIVDPTILNYIGGVKISVETFDQKDNTLFLGNINIKTQSLKAVTTDEDWSVPLLGFNGFDIDSYYKTIRFADNESGFYPYKNQLNGGINVFRGVTKSINDSKLPVNLENPKIFKHGEYYRFGIQCQDLNGIWSDVVWLGDYEDNVIPQDYNNNTKKFPVFAYTIKKETANKLFSLGYRKARIVCCYTTNNDRTVIAQGVLCPTIYNKKWQEKDSPNYIGSWFYRTITDEPYVITRNEIQSVIDGSDVYTGTRYIKSGSPSDDSKFFCSDKPSTFHSPEIEFDESLRTLDWSKLKLRVVGESVQYSYTTKVYLNYIKQAEDYLGNKGNGFIDNSVSKYGGVQYPTIDYAVWNDINVYNSNYVWKNGVRGGDEHTQIDYITYNYNLYPFQRKYLNNYMGDCDIVLTNDRRTDKSIKITESSIINNKVWSTLKLSYNSDYNTPENIEISDCQVFDSNEVIPVQFKDKFDGKHIYYGNVNTIAPIDLNVLYYCDIYENQGMFEGETTPSNSGENESDDIIRKFLGHYVIENQRRETTKHKYNYLGVSSDPIQISYKSTPHCIINLNEDLPNISTPYALRIAELYRDVDVSQRFGGTTEDALKNNVFIPCGKAVDLIQYNNTSISNIQIDPVIIGDIGDTYYMRYDNLKTYPYTREDINGIVEIFSFMCESRINLDGRCDKNRGFIDNTLIDNTNFNIINKSYTQTDNFFNYRVLDDTSANIDSFPNQITWTKTKNAGEEVDSWTNITLASVAEADGTLGKITKICNNKDNLIMFQEHGIAFLGYNEKTAISTANGVPLEIANSGKFTGFAYNTKNVGCQNKWSVNNNKNGIFWIDDSRRQLFTFGENGLTSISTLNGLDAFIINNIEGKHSKWSPKDFNTSSTSANFVTYYDSLSKDIYYINNDYCIAWNEITGTFTSFYDYNRIPYISNISQYCLMTYLNNNNIELYSAREDDSYSKFFGINKPYWIVLMSNGGSDDKGNYTLTDKVFNTIEYKGDLFNENIPVIYNNINMINMPLFTDIAAYNGYQAYKEFKIDGRYNSTNNHNAYMEYPWKAERKFNMWRVIIPRATYNKDNELVTSKDRIRNPYTYIKLINNEPERYFPDGSSNNRAILSDFIVSFDIR